MKRDREDRLMAELFKRELPQAPANEWFTPRVLNRLPKRNGRISIMIESVSMVVAVAILVVYIYSEYSTITRTGIITVGNMLCIGVLGLFSAFLVLWPLVRRFYRMI